MAVYLSLLPTKSFPADLGRYSVLLPKEYSGIQGENIYRIKGKDQGKNYEYSGTLVRADKKGSAWFVYDTLNQEVIGDEADEGEEYAALAVNFEIERFDSLNPAYPATLRKLSRYYTIELIEHEVTFKIPNFVLEEGSKLEGMLVGAIASGGANLSAEAQNKMIESIVTKESANIINEFKKKINLSDEEANPLDIALKLKKYLEQTLEYNIVESGKKLELAADIFEKNQDLNWTPKKAIECFNNWIEGHALGLAYVKLMNDIENNVDWNYISRKIASNFTQGLAGKSLSEIASEFDITGEFLNDPDMTKAFNNFNDYLKIEIKKFDSLIGRFNLEDPNSPASQFINSEWPKNSNNLEARKTLLNYINGWKTLDENLLLSATVGYPALSLPEFSPPENRSALELTSLFYSCHEFDISEVSSQTNNVILYLKEKSSSNNCNDIFKKYGIEYRGELFYLKKINNSWKIVEILNLSKDGLVARARSRLSSLATNAISEYAETLSWPKPFGPEPGTIPSFEDNILGTPCNLPYHGLPSENQCYFSYRSKPGKVDASDLYVIEAVGNLDSDPDLEVLQIGVGSKTLKELRRD